LTISPFDTDSCCKVAIDNCTSECFTNDINDFITRNRVTGTVHGIGKQWEIIDNQGRRHTFKIHNVVLNTNLPFRLLAPHVLAQQRQDLEGAGCTTLGNYCEFFWDNRQYKRCIPFDASNIASMYSAPGYTKYAAFANTVTNHK
jgi:hypothetical protein